MRKKELETRRIPMNLNLFGHGDGDGDGKGAGGDDPNGKDDKPSEDGDETDDDDNADDDAEEKKYSDKDMEDAVKKRLAREKRKWQRDQQRSVPTDDKDDKAAGKDNKEDSGAENKARKAEEKAANLELKWVCLEHDVEKSCVDDVLALAKVLMSKHDDMDVEDAIDAVIKKYPHFKDGYDTEDNDGSGQPKKGWGQRHEKPQKNGATVEEEIKKQMFGK